MVSRNATPEERRAYNQAWRDKRLADARASLGGRCAVCGSTDALQFDHVDPATKVRAISECVGNTIFWSEVAKCQLLCGPHHKEKTAVDRLPPHGSDRRYRKPHGCRCDVCRAESNRRRRETRARTSTAVRPCSP